MNSREELEAALRESGAAPAPAPDPAFVASLERRLVAGRTNVVPLARRARRMSATAIVVTSVVFAGAAAAAAGIVATHPFRDTPPATTDQPTTSADGATTTEVATTTSVPVVLPPTVAPTVTPTVAPTLPPTLPPTVAPTAPPTTAPPTTEVHTAPVMTITCSSDGTAVQCSWTAGPAGTAKYLVLRSQPSAGQGRAYTVDAGTTTWTDPLGTPGTTATYLVHAFDANGVDLGHSNAVSVGCC